MKSMTGYGRAILDKGNALIEVEIRSINGRFFNFSGKLPLELLSFEQEVKKIVGKKIKRGSITVIINYRKENDELPDILNLKNLERYFLQLSSIAKTLDTEPPSLHSLLSIPGVFDKSNVDSVSSEEWIPIKDTINKALEQLIKMRQEEGDGISKEIHCYYDEIGVAIEEIAQIAPQITKNYQLRVENRMKELMENKDFSAGEQDILREIAIFSEKADISEEIVRMKSHLRQFQDVSGQVTAVGRTLEFILQEMVREVNTIASKANDAVCSSEVVKLKSAIEKIREQLQNIE